MYYRIALIARMEVNPDSPFWNVYQDLICAGHAVEVLDPDLYPGILDADGCLVEDAIAQFRATFKPDYISFGDETAEEVIDACKASGATGLPMPAKRFVVFGYLGKNNFGDEFIFSIIRKTLAERWPESYVAAIGQGPAATFARHGVVSIEPNMKTRMDVLLNGAAALVLMAGIVFDDPYFSMTAGRTELFLNPYSEIPGQVSCVQLAWIHGVPSVYLGIGAGPLDNPDAQAVLRLGSLCRPRFAARDKETAGLLIEAGIDTSLVEETADVAFAISHQRDRFVQPSPGESPCITVALRDFASVDDTFVERVAFALDRMVEEFGAQVTFIDFAPEDRDIHERTARAMESDGWEIVLPQSDEEMLAQIGRGSLMLATRLHASIISNAFGIPSVGFNYDGKVQSHYALMDATELLCPMDAHREEIASALKTALQNRSDISRMVSERVAACLRKSERNFDILAEEVGAHRSTPQRIKVYPKQSSTEAIQLSECQRLLASKQAEIEKLKAELEEIKDSTTWAAGRIVTAIPRAAKSLCADRDQGENDA